MSELGFVHLNLNWNAEPNAPSPALIIVGNDAELSFLLDDYPSEAERRAIVRFINCSRWRWDPTNDHGWFDGNGRFSQQAPKWGEFYEIIGDDVAGRELDWEIIAPDAPGTRHFLFYFRDETIECIAMDWSISV